MEFYIIRHGLTKYNGQGILLGKSDPGLLNNNDPNILRWTPYFSNLEFQYIIHSGKKRTKETSLILRDHMDIKPPIKIDNRLQEMDFGDWELRSYDWLYQNQQEIFLEWLKDPFHIAPPNGETLYQLRERIFSFFEEWSYKNYHRPFLIVTHGGPIRLLWSIIHDAPFFEKEVAPGSLFYLHWPKQILQDISDRNFSGIQ